MCSQNLFGQGALPSPGQGRCSHFVQPWGGAQTPNRVLAQDLDEPCAGKSGAVLCGFYGVDTDKIYRRIGGFWVVVRQKHRTVTEEAELHITAAQLGCSCLEQCLPQQSTPSLAAG